MPDFESTRAYPHLLAIVLPLDNPDDSRYLIRPGSGFDGVVLLEFPDDGICTGSLLTTGRHILTAAHCFEEQQQTGKPTLNPDPNQVSIVFQLRNGEVRMGAKAVFIHPLWDNSENYNNDLAVIELDSVAPETVQRYAIYRRSDEVGQMFMRVGYGAKGTGWKGEVAQDRNPSKRLGGNRYDTLGETLNQPPVKAKVLPGTQLVYDFDNGLKRNDALGVEYGLNDLGVLGWDWGSHNLAGRSTLNWAMVYESGASTGDSGSPAFINGKIAGVASNGYSSEAPGLDVTRSNDTSFGEYFFDTRVSAYQDFIDDILERPITKTQSVPSWTSIGLILVLGLVLWRKFRLRN